jgi:hypothetical protein
VVGISACQRRNHGTEAAPYICVTTLLHARQQIFAVILSTLSRAFHETRAAAERAQLLIEQAEAFDNFSNGQMRG